METQEHLNLNETEVAQNRILNLNALKEKFDDLTNEIKKLQESNIKMQEKLYLHEKKIMNLQDTSTLKRRLRAFIRPKLGVLEQYPSQTWSLPKRYKHKPILKNPPSISIITPSFNQAKYLEKTLLSMINQHYPDLELIIQDGGSSDGSLQVISRYEHHLKHWESKKDSGQSNALNLGFRHSTGEIMAYLNSDDLLLEGALHYIADYFVKNPEVDVIYSHRIVIDENDYEIGRWVLPKHNNEALSWADFVPQETLFWRRRIWDKVGGAIDENFKFAMDWDLLLRFRDAGANFVRLPRFLGAFRVHSSQKTSTAMSSTGIEEMELLKRRCHGRAVTVKEINTHLRFYKLQHVFLHKLYRAGILRY